MGQTVDTSGATREQIAERWRMITMVPDTDGQDVWDTLRTSDDHDAVWMAVRRLATWMVDGVFPDEEDRRDRVAEEAWKAIEKLVCDFAYEIEQERTHPKEQAA